MTAISVIIGSTRQGRFSEKPAQWAHFQGGDVEKGLAETEKQAKAMIDDLLWWTTALKTAREH